MIRHAISALFVFLFLPAFPLAAFDLELFPEMADKNAVFLNIKALSISFTEGFILKGQEFGFDYVLPLAPLSLGAYLTLPDPNLKSFGVRAAWHINIHDEKTDLYGLYVFDFGFVRNATLRAYGDEEQPIRYYDFRIGVRRLFGQFFCLTLESGYKMRGFNIGISVKLN